MAPSRWEESGHMHLATREEESRKVWICAQISPDSKAWPGYEVKNTFKWGTLKHFQHRYKIQTWNKPLGGTAVETSPNNAAQGQGWTDCLHLQEGIMILNQPQQASQYRKARNTARRAATPWNQLKSTKQREDERRNRKRHAEAERGRRGRRAGWQTRKKTNKKWFPVLVFIGSVQSQVHNLLAVIIYNTHPEEAIQQSHARRFKTTPWTDDQCFRSPLTRCWIAPV